MHEKEIRKNVGIIAPLSGSASNLCLSALGKMLLPASKDLYLIAGNADPKDYTRAYVYSIKYKTGTNVLTRIINYIYLQARISYRLAKLARNVDFWFFLLGAETLLIPMLTAKLLGKKVALILVGYIEIEGEKKGDILYKVLNSVKKFNLAFSDVIVLYSRSLIKGWNLEKYRNKICIAETFVDLVKFKIEKPLNHRDNLIGYIGRLSPEKGVMDFVGAITEISKEMREAKFLVGGDGQLRHTIEEYFDNNHLRDKVRLTGWIPHEALPKYLNELKLLILPSYTEGLPNIMLEAMACGTPVLATPVGAIPDIIKDEEVGFIMGDNSPHCIAKNINRALNHPNLEEIVKSARSFVNREFTYEKAIERYQQVLKILSAGEDQGEFVRQGK